jgi:tetratricopeptide (TPR) repeat protein
MTGASHRTIGPRSRSVARVAALALAWIGLGTGCASLPGGGAGESTASPATPARTERPELGPDYDVMVGELATRDGDFMAARRAYERAVAKDPGSAWLHFRLARLAAQTDDLAVALIQAQMGHALDPDDNEGRIFLARLYRLNRDLAAVARVLTDANGQPVNSAAALLLQQAYLESGRLEEALAVAEELTRSDPDNLAGYMAVATVYERLGRYDEAEAALRAALDRHPNRFVIYSRLARMQRARGDRSSEIAVYREVLAEYPDHYGTLVSLGEAQIADSDIEGAIETYRQIARAFPDDLQVVRRLASLEFGAGHYEQAADRLREAATRHPEHYEFAYSLGQVLRGLGEDDEALEVFESIPRAHALYVEARMQIAVILEEQQRFPEALVEIDALRELRPDRGLDFHAASLRARTGDFEGGVALLKAMLVENPADDEVLYQLGVLYGLHGSSDQAMLYMQEVLDHNPDNAQALNYIGYSWAERGENLDEAERLIKLAVKLSPRDGYIADSLGWVYYMRARPMLGSDLDAEGRALLQLALEQLDLAVELTGGDPVVSEHLGDVYLLLEDRRRALDYYEEAVELKPREDEQPDLMDKLEGLRQELGSGSPR